jgi:hypothetical protein
MGGGAIEALATKAAVAGEFGGYPAAVPSHPWPRIFTGTFGMRQRAMMRRHLRKLCSEARGLRNRDGISAVVYTELMDQEQEHAGLMTFDRAMVKLPIAQIYHAVTGQLGKVHEGTAIRSRARGDG